MTQPLYLSRATLRRDVPAAALLELLLPGDAGRRAGVGHRLVWTLFTDGPDRERDFLWREAENGTFYLLSRRKPEDRHGLFCIDPPKEFAPSLTIGDRLSFSLRANPTVAKKTEGKSRGAPVDVVMAAIHDVPRRERALKRNEAVQTAGRQWIAEQGARCGFRLVPELENESGSREVLTEGVLRISGYRSINIDHSGPRACIGVMDFDGVLEVRDPQLFLASVGRGFGRAKAFGCGLMLLRRVVM
ncbi:MAG: type I-E CRISPR-associated protein Cas6/Cse3/CasE [Gemmatimonadota bacterium]|jgi:CRISPR system Cascade subunit CasE|nr:type I-E CRISPR-associated protein Cas6/Cse3/CasE [Gemmatimonadota bacterium]